MSPRGQRHVQDEEWFAGKVALVTGGAGGIGTAIARGLAHAGARVVIADIDGAAVDRICGQLAESELEVSGVQMNAADSADVLAGVGRVVADFGRLDFVVTSHGGEAPQASISDLDPEAWGREVGAHLTGTFLCAHATARHLVASRGSLLAIASNYGFKARPGRAAYAASKAGVVSLVKTLATELAPDVRVNAVAPGPVLTPRWIGGRSDAELAERIAERSAEVPLGRLGDPDDIAAAATFLLGPGAAWITGQTLHVNGGEMM